MAMIFRERLPYSAIVDRPTLRLPNGARMVVWVIVNVENWENRRPMPRTVLSPPMNNKLVPDLPNWSWHEYGMRVGFWRFLDCLKKSRITLTLAINGSVCETYPRIAEVARSEGWEFAGHGWLQGPMHALEDQRASIRRTIETIKKFTGKPPRGWESPGLTETFDTIDLLAEEGIEYVADWVLDDQPCEIKTTSRPVVALPYTVEVNDVPMMVVAQHSSDELLKRGLRQFDRLYQESAEIMRIMSISIHPYLTGAPIGSGISRSCWPTSKTSRASCSGPVRGFSVGIAARTAKFRGSRRTARRLRLLADCSRSLPGRPKRARTRIPKASLPQPPLCRPRSESG